MAARASSCRTNGFRPAGRCPTPLTGTPRAGSLDRSGCAIPAGTRSGCGASRPYTLDDKLHGEYREYARSATDAAFEGILCGNARLTVNSPSRNRLVDHKPFQLQLAHRCRLRVPRTLVTNDPEEARRFVFHHGRAVTKSIASWRFRLIESRLLEAGDLPDLSSIALCPVLLQEYVDGTTEYRVTVIGTRVFAAKVDLSDAPYPVDVRLHFSRKAEAAELPQGLPAAVPP